MTFDGSLAHQLIPLQPGEVRQYWHLIEPGLLSMINDGMIQGRWNAPEVYSLLVANKATIYMCSVHRAGSAGYKDRDEAIEDASGFYVLTKDAELDGFKLNIWIAVSNDNTNKQQSGSIMRIFRQELIQLSKDLGCNAITFSSNLKWWNKVAPHLGFEMDLIKWRLPV